MDDRVIRNRDVVVRDSGQIQIKIVRRKGGKGRLKVSTEFDPLEIEDVHISVLDESVKSDVHAEISVSNVGP